MDKYVSKHAENQQNGTQNFLKSGNFLKIFMPVLHRILYVGISECQQSVCTNLAFIYFQANKIARNIFHTNLQAFIGIKISTFERNMRGWGYGS